MSLPMGRSIMCESRNKKDLSFSYALHFYKKMCYSFMLFIVTFLFCLFCVYYYATILHKDDYD